MFQLEFTGLRRGQWRCHVKDRCIEFYKGSFQLRPTEVALSCCTQLADTLLWAGLPAPHFQIVQERLNISLTRLFK